MTVTFSTANPRKIMSCQQDKSSIIAHEHRVIELGAKPDDLPSNFPPKLSGFDFYHSLGSPKYFVAPMVDHSELCYRMLCRKYNADICYTPMIHSRLFVEHPEYRVSNFQTCLNDRPLIAQLCGNDPDIVVKAAEFLQPHVDAIDLNLGCPQQIARKGFYGSFLLDHPELVSEIVSQLHEKISVPITCKIRLLPTLSETLSFCQMLERSGCQLLVIHGRTREMKKNQVTAVNWDWISKIKQHLNIPVIANGGIEHFDDIHTCLNECQVDGVMSSEAVLENPALFANNIDPLTKKKINQLDLAKEYMELTRVFPTSLKVIRTHMFKFLHIYLQEYLDLRQKVAKASTVQAFHEIVDEIAIRLEQENKDDQQQNTWYRRYRKNEMETEDSRDLFPSLYNLK